MGKVFRLPLRGQPGDLDALAKVMALTTMAVELTRFAQHGEDDVVEVVLNDQQMRLSREDMLRYAEDMIEQRQALLDAMGARAAAALAERIARAIRASRTPRRCPPAERHGGDPAPPGDARDQSRSLPTTIRRPLNGRVPIAFAARPSE